MKMRHINQVAVVGSGIMGSGIACHFANAGIKVILLDIVTPGLSEEMAKNKQAKTNIRYDKHEISP